LCCNSVHSVKLLPDEERKSSQSAVLVLPPGSEEAHFVPLYADVQVADREFGKVMEVRPKTGKRAPGLRHP